MEFTITFAQAKTRVDDYISFMQSLGYKASTRKVVAQNVRCFLNSEDSSRLLTENSLYEFVNNRYDPMYQRSRYNSVLGACRRFFCYIYWGDFSKAQHVSETSCLPEKFKLLLDAFIYEHSIGNCANTSTKKQTTITNFLKFLLDNGVHAIHELNNTLILNYLHEKTPETRACIRSFLRYLFSYGLLANDYSVLIHITKRPKKLPTIYSEEEIRSLINVFTGDDLTAKRNKAIVLIIATTGMRSSDIVQLKYSDFHFEKKCIEIVQVKTGIPLSLTLDEETAAAVMDYYRDRPGSAFENLFINQNAPFNPISTGIIRYVLRRAFAAAKIDVVGKQRGPHTLRSSLASAMVKSGISYEVVQNQLGHQSNSSLSYYVRFDIEKLRGCALESLPATGNFKRWLEERV